MARQINNNLRYLAKNYTKKKGIILEGSSRSGKTWSSIDFIIFLSCHVETGAVINIIKETYNSFKTTLYDDFQRRLPMYNIDGSLDQAIASFQNKRDVDHFYLFGNKINLIGADKPSKFEGAGSDYAYFNELLNISEEVFKQVKQRCRKFWWGDYNPKFTRHWVFKKVVTRDDVGFLKTTFLDNPYISDGELTEILGYEPTPENIRQGTASLYDWNVYGLGNRAAQEGVIFVEGTNWSEVDKWPEDFKWSLYGMDFGFSPDPSTLIEVGYVNGELYLREHLWKTGLTNDEIYEEINEIVQSEVVVADSAEMKSIAEINNLGLYVEPAAKGPDSIRFGIKLMKKYKINVHKDSLNLLDEFRSYKWLVTKNGDQTGKPVDRFNHGIDPTRYALSYQLGGYAGGVSGAVLI